jgi:hypothetical protein
MATAALAGALLATASAKAARFESRISIHTRYDDSSMSPYAFSGRVRSKKGGCVAHRTVVLKNEASALGDSYTDSTNALGRWRITLQIDTLVGDYFAKVKRHKKRHHVCTGARSDAVPAPSPPT